jgi:hypothetical protein
MPNLKIVLLNSKFHLFCMKEEVFIGLIVKQRFYLLCTIGFAIKTPLA